MSHRTLQARLGPIALALVLLSSCASQDLDPASPQGPSLSRQSDADSAGQYVVLMRQGTTEQQRDALLLRYSVDSPRTYRRVAMGFTANLSANTARALRQEPEVEFLAPNERRQVLATSVDSSAGWGVGRIDQRYGPPDSVFSYDTSGDGINIYVLDSGVDAAHSDFGTRVYAGWTRDSNEPSDMDCHGHGTAVASVAAGAAYGVAKEATIYSVSVIDCGGGATLDDILGGMEWVALNASLPAVLNISLNYGGSFGNVVRSAAVAVKSVGVVVVAAAGNDNGNACDAAPGGATAIMTVAATDPDDKRRSTSNYGTCVDIFAPGTNIDGAITTSLTGGYGTFDGTSVAAPIVSGVAALLLEKYPADTPDQIYAAIVDGGTSGVVTNAGSGSPNLFIYSNLPAPVMVTIIGPGTVGPFMHCQWSALVKAGRGPFTYSWSGVKSGSSSTINGPISTTGWLNIEVWDAISGYAGNSRWITVDNGNHSVFCS